MLTTTAEASFNSSSRRLKALCIVASLMVILSFLFMGCPSAEPPVAVSENDPVAVAMLDGLTNALGLATQKAGQTNEIVHAFILATDRLRERKALRKPFALEMHRNSEQDAWVLRFVFLPRKLDDEATVFVYDDGRIEH